MKKAVIVATLALAFGWAQQSHAQHAYPADNTGKNVRDRSGDTLTAGDQPESAADRDITQGVRKAIMADKGLSMNAHNVKIITVNGVVTLRGPVDSPAEKTKVASAAHHVAGVKRVDNQVEIVSR